MDNVAERPVRAAAKKKHELFRFRVYGLGLGCKCECDVCMCGYIHMCM
jgi:hypothetical protein